MSRSLAAPGTIESGARRSSWVVVGVAGILLLGGCAQNVTGTPAAAPASVQPGATVAPPEAPTDTSEARSGTDGCRVSISAGSVRMSGGGRVRTINGAHQFACRTGPLVAVQSVDAGGVRFGLDGASVLVAADATEQVGPYRITVRELAGPAAEFDVTPAG